VAVPDAVLDGLLDGLDDDQRAAVTTPEQPLAILAPAGSGKTRVLTRRIAYRIREGSAEARHVLALTFTRKAAGELVTRLDRLGAGGPVTAGTFHAVALAELRRRAIERGWDPPRVLDRKHRLLADLIGRSNAAPGAVAADIEWAKARLVAPAGIAAAARASGRRLASEPSTIADLFARYEAELRRRHLLDFDDLLRRCADEMRSDETFRAAQHWRFRHLFVDEFQDATPLQLALLRAWLGDHTDLCVVGDPAQAIYGFAGADASPLREFGRTFAGGHTVALTRNYRSTTAIVASSEVALASGSVARATPHAVRGPGDAPTIVGFDSDHTEATEIAAACRRAFTCGTAWRDIAILFRTNAQSARFEAALTARGIPFHVAEAARLASRPELRPLLEYLRDREREERGRSFGEHLAELATDDALESDTAREQLLSLGREYLADETAPSVAGFAAWLDVSARGEPIESGVTLVTFHRAKGLEWPVVFVTGLERGLVPISWATTAEARAEERRLLHVACSRAEDELHLSWARTRTLGAGPVSRQPTPWLASLEDAARAQRELTRDRYAHFAEVRATLAAVTPAPPTPRGSRVRR
jgi:DNA helicase-2/ATP-dependent DNA helicase PcrA